ncbi:MAG: hypothetical protein KF895_09950 [Parvibaculum sp.]|nr:hypothetical protein [Parvibaculum sp.]
MRSKNTRRLPVASNPVTVALRRKKELMAELDRIEKFLAAAAEFSDGANAKKAAGGSSGGPRTSAGPKPAQVVSAVEKILSGAEKPMTRGELLNELKALGLEIGGSNPANTLGTTISRDPERFVNLRGLGYWLRSRDFLPGGHHAGQGDRELSGEASDDHPPLH